MHEARNYRVSALTTGLTGAILFMETWEIKLTTEVTEKHIDSKREDKVFLKEAVAKVPGCEIATSLHSSQ